MTDHEYFNDHIPHRVNLLTTFRERFSDLCPHKINPEDLRDFYRCSKDISMLMVRFLLGELGINLVKGHSDVSEKLSNKFVKKLLVRDLIKDPDYASVLTVLKAANRAVAHMEDNEVNHPIQTDLDNPILFSAIDYTEAKIISNMYVHSKQDYNAIMKNPNNDMERKTPVF